jgi:RNA polymerase sigma-70 factor (ECF subfamily)
VTDERDEELAAQAAAGDRRAFSSLMERHYDRIHALAWRWSGSRDRAEDIAQDVCVKLAQAVGTFRGEAAFTTWLYRLAYSTAIDNLRRTQRTLPLEPSHLQALIAIPDGSTPESDVMGAELWRAVRTLPGQQRDAVLLVYGEDLSHAEAAEIMGCTEKTVSWHLFEARKRLKTLLDAVA